ncbi:hypothetical protein Anapl_04653 [Anas platyrhynchos]|uniref:Uncharacterized protein n=1 Tax=Anas platyrhynchos TaxID=8839 RepID=R0LQQ4_ANAPL|nr:hypothetical protein Anapl_04653 [Anas platyrhynchos]
MLRGAPSREKEASGTLAVTENLLMNAAGHWEKLARKWWSCCGRAVLSPSTSTFQLEMMLTTKHIWAWQKLDFPLQANKQHRCAEGAASAAVPDVDTALGAGSESNSVVKHKCDGRLNEVVTSALLSALFQIAVELVPRQLAPMGAVRENPSGVCLKQFAFHTVVFRSHPPVGTLWGDILFGEIAARAAQKIRLIWPLAQGVPPAHPVDLRTDSRCCSLLVCWLWAAVGAGCGSWELFLLLENATEMLLLPLLKIRLLHVNFSHLENEDIISQKEIFRSYLWGKRCSERKRTNINSNFSLAFGILVVGHSLIFWTVSEQGKGAES